MRYWLVPPLLHVTFNSLIARWVDAGWVAGLGGFGTSASAQRNDGAGDRTSTSVRLLTELPPQRPAAEQALAQRGACAGCRSPLPSPVKGTMFGSGAAKVG